MLINCSQEVDNPSAVKDNIDMGIVRPSASSLDHTQQKHAKLQQTSLAREESVSETKGKE
jgi:hypothetical protein